MFLVSWLLISLRSLANIAVVLNGKMRFNLGLTEIKIQQNILLKIECPKR